MSVSADLQVGFAGTYGSADLQVGFAGDVQVVPTFRSASPVTYIVPIFRSASPVAPFVPTFRSASPPVGKGTELVLNAMRKLIQLRGAGTPSAPCLCPRVHA